MDEKSLGLEALTKETVDLVNAQLPSIAAITLQERNLKLSLSLSLSLSICLSVFSQESIPIEEVFEQLRCSKEGLTTEEGENRIKIFGPNKLEEKSVSAWGGGACCPASSRPIDRSIASCSFKSPIYNPRAMEELCGNIL
jgi:hypothetical protein